MTSAVLCSCQLVSLSSEPRCSSLDYTPAFILRKTWFLNAFGAQNPRTYGLRIGALQIVVAIDDPSWQRLPAKTFSSRRPLTIIRRPLFCAESDCCAAASHTSALRLLSDSQKRNVFGYSQSRLRSFTQFLTVVSCFRAGQEAGQPPRPSGGLLPVRAQEAGGHVRGRGGRGGQGEGRPQEHVPERDVYLSDGQ